MNYNSAFRWARSLLILETPKGSYIIKPGTSGEPDPEGVELTSNDIPVSSRDFVLDLMEY